MSEKYGNNEQSVLIYGESSGEIPGKWNDANYESGISGFVCQYYNK